MSRTKIRFIVLLAISCSLATRSKGFAVGQGPASPRHYQRTPKAKTTTVTGENGGGEGSASSGGVAAASADNTSSKSAPSSSPSVSKLIKCLYTSYEPNPNDGTFLSRLQSQTTPTGVTVKSTVLTGAESRRFFAVPLTQRGVQAVYIEIDNTMSDDAVFLDRVRIDPNYFSATEAAALCRLASPKLLAGIGFLSALIFLPLALLLPLKMATAFPANRRMEQFFRKHEFPLGICAGGQFQRGFIYTSLDNGGKIVPIDLIGPTKTEKLVFNIPLSDLAVDFEKGESLTEMEKSTTVRECIDLKALKAYLEQFPRAVTNKKGSNEGDPVNLVVIGDFETVLATFTGARWDQTEIINLTTCTKVAKSFLFQSEYRYSPVSALYLQGRPQDFALQRARGTINERLHLRLWWTPRAWEGKTVWIGQVSRDVS